MRQFITRQGSEEWLRLRLGVPTASNFEKLIQPKKWEPTKGDTRNKYKMFLLTELILDEPLSEDVSAAMHHGTTHEENARAAYEMQMGVDVLPGGFCTNDDETFGASPDGFVGEDGLVQFKCPFKPEIHTKYLMNPLDFAEEYFVQTQGELFVTGRKWNDLVSYVGIMPMVRVRIEPVPEFQEKLAQALHSFCAEFTDLCERAVQAGHLDRMPMKPTEWFKPPKKQRHEEFITDQDVEDHIANLKAEGVF